MKTRLILSGCVAIVGIAVPAFATDSELISSIRSGDAARWQALMTSTDLSARDDAGNTPLHVAAYVGDSKAVDALLAHGAQVDALNKTGASPLLYGVGNEGIVRSLLARGANPNLASSLEITPLEAAASHKDSHAVVALLLKAGADVHAKRHGIETVLLDATYSEDPQTIQLLLDHGARVEPQKPLAPSPLASAIYFGNTAMVNQLLDHGAHVDFDADFAGHSLNFALYSQYTDIAALLIRKGADIHQKSEWGHATPPMVFAAYNQSGDPTIAKMLIERGAAINEPNEMGDTALSYALRTGSQTPLVAYLRSMGAKEPVSVPSTLSLNAQRMPAGASIAQRAQTAIDLLQKASTGFINNKFVHETANCVSCHHETLPAASFALGSTRGLHIDEAALGHQIAAQLAMWRPTAEHAREMDDPVPDSPVQLGYGLMALKAVGYPADPMTESLVRYLIEEQAADGSWHWSDVRPPLEGGRFTATAWAARAIELYPPPHMDPQIQACLAKVRGWMKSHEPKTLGDQVQQLAGLNSAGASRSALKPFAAGILAKQQPGGGWSQLPGLEPDAWATGEALVALNEAKCLSVSDAAYKKGVQFLLKTQYEDGSWWVHSRTWPFQPHFDSGFPHGNDQWISAGGTAWATMALLLTLEPKSPPAHLPVSDALVAAYQQSLEKAKAAPAVASLKTITPTIDFAHQVYPVFERSCIKCHSGEKPRAGLSLASRDALLKGGKSGEPAVIPGNGSDSQIVAYISDEVEDLEMPPLKHRDQFKSLSQTEIALIRTWIDEGAAWNLAAPSPKT